MNKYTKLILQLFNQYSKETPCDNCLSMNLWRVISFCLFSNKHKSQMFVNVNTKTQHFFFPASTSMHPIQTKLNFGHRRFVSSHFFLPATGQAEKQRRWGLTNQAVFPSSMARVFSAARAKPSAVSASSKLLLAWWTFSSCSLSPQTNTQRHDTKSEQDLCECWKSNITVQCVAGSEHSLPKTWTWYSFSPTQEWLCTAVLIRAVSKLAVFFLLVLWNHWANIWFIPW